MSYMIKTGIKIGFARKQFHDYVLGVGEIKAAKDALGEQ